MLLPISINRALRDKEFAIKRSAYATTMKDLDDESHRNLLARSLVTHPADISEFMTESGLPFTPCEEFRKADLEARERLYQRLGRRIWGIEAICDAATT